MDAPATLADFLRSARSRLSPADVGLSPSPIGGARRVPGLRRDEVASLAGVSMDYYTRMEQGRVTRASDAVVGGIASALRLSETERDYLFSLLATSSGGRPQRSRTHKVRPALRAILDSLTGSPAFVVGVGLDVLAMNSLAASLMVDFTRRSGNERSLAHWTFRAPEARDFYVEWEKVAADFTSTLRKDVRNHPADRALAHLIAELSDESAEFRARWAEHRVFECTFGTKRLVHPLVGRVDVEYESFPVPGIPDQQLFIYGAKTGSPSDDALRILASWGAEVPAPTAS